MQRDNRYQDELGLILFGLLFISLLPIIISTSIIPGLNFMGVYSLLVGIMFFLQTIIMILYYCVYTERSVKRELFLYAWLFLIAQGLTIYLALLRDTQIENYDLINIFVRFISVLIFLTIPSNLAISPKGLKSFMSLIVLLGVVASVYNLLLNYSGIINIFSISNPYAVNFKSFFINRNGFAQFLFFAFVANTYLFFTKKNTYYLLVYLLLAINLITTLSRSGIVALGIFLLIFFFVYFKERYLFKVIVVLIGFISAIIVLLNQQLNEFIVNLLIRETVGTASRIDIWRIGLEILNQSNWLLGVGYFTSVGYILDSGYRVTEFHNFYLETLVGGGIIDLLLQLAILFFILVKINHIYKNDRLTGIIYFGSYLSLFFYAFFESISFFSMGYVGTIYIIFFITIPLLYANSFRN